MHLARYLTGVIMCEPTLKVCGVKSGHQTSALQDSQFDGRIPASSDDIMECIFLSHRIIMSPLVLENSKNNNEYTNS